MKRYIDADALLEEINEVFPNLTMFNNIEAVSIRERLYTFPTADVVEVVRCRDCKESEICPDTLLWCNQFERLVPPNGFCHCGERREDNDKN